MSELRWTLLILGVVFIAALSWWERRRPRQAFAPRLRETGVSSFADAPPREAQRVASAEPAVAGEPWIGEAGLSDVVSADVSLTDSADEPAADDPAHTHLAPAMPGPLDELPTLIIPDEDRRMALRAAWEEQPPEPTLIDPEASVTVETLPPIEAAEPTPAPAPSEPHARPTESHGHAAIEPNAQAPSEPHAQATSEPRAQARSEAQMRPTGESHAHATPSAAAAQDRELPAETARTTPTPAAGLATTGSGTSASEAMPEREIFGSEGVGAVRIVLPAASDCAAPPEPVVEWPPEESRRILALRIVAPPTERFAGRVLRLALAAEGFLIGKFAIFHKPDEDNRAVLSAASLSRPGAFDLQTMDSQRFTGLSLFAVLPGSKPPPQAFEELLATARNLNERLQGALQDERGGPLTPLRVASIRDGLRAETTSLKAAAAP